MLKQAAFFLQGEVMTFTSFLFNYKNIEMKVSFWAKDFSAVYESAFGQMIYGLHIMYMCPKIYTEQLLKTGYCPGIAEEFIKTEKYLTENPDFINSKKEEYDKADSKYKFFEKLKQETGIDFRVLEKQFYK